jgi:hypothetical protein
MIIGAVAVLPSPSTYLCENRQPNAELTGEPPTLKMKGSLIASPVE